VGFCGFTYWLILPRRPMVASDVYEVFASTRTRSFPFHLHGPDRLVSGIAGKLYDTRTSSSGTSPEDWRWQPSRGDGLQALCGSRGGDGGHVLEPCHPPDEPHGYSRTLGNGPWRSSGTLGCLMPPTSPYYIRSDHGAVDRSLFLAVSSRAGGLAVLWILTIFIWAKITPGLAPAAGGPPGREIGPCLR
jgi:hypothetical protein